MSPCFLAHISQSGELSAGPLLKESRLALVKTTAVSHFGSSVI